MTDLPAFVSDEDEAFDRLLDQVREAWKDPLAHVLVDDERGTCRVRVRVTDRHGILSDRYFGGAGWTPTKALYAALVAAPAASSEG